MMNTQGVQQDKKAIQRTMTVPASAAHAFASFTQGMAEWWPAEYTWSRDVLQTMAIEPGPGGRCFERGPHNFECDWGRVLVWEPPHRLVFTWQISPNREPEPNPAKASECEGEGKVVKGKKAKRVSSGMRRPHPALQWLGSGILMMGILLLCSNCAPQVCNAAERAALAEFPQYGGVSVTSEGNVDTGACAVFYSVSDAPVQVQTYFQEQLMANGWTVEPLPPAGTLIEAQRGGFTYLVYYETVNVSPQETRTNLAVHVEEQE